MTDVEDLVTDLLTRSADAVEVHPDLDAVVAGLAAERETSRRPAVVVLAAAALVAVALVVGTVVADGDRSQSVDTATDPPTTAPVVTDGVEVPDRYPAFGVLPTWLDGSFYATEDDPSSGVSGIRRTVLGREAADGTLDLYALDLADEPTFADELAPATVLGRPAGVLQQDTPEGPGGLLAIPGEVEVLLNGPGDIRAVAEELGWGVLEPVVEDGVVRPALGPLPDGWEVVGGPAPVDASAEVEIGVSGHGDESVTLLAGDTLDGGILGPQVGVRRVDVGSGEGLLASAEGRGQGATTTLYWRAGGVRMALLTTGLTDDEVLAVAEGVELLAPDAWRERVRPDSGTIPFDVVDGELVPR